MSIPENERRAFIDYVWSWYGPGSGGDNEWGTASSWHDQPITMSEVEHAADLLIRNYTTAWDADLRFDGGSMDREIVRDVVLRLRGVDGLEWQPAVERICAAEIVAVMS
jgi:hypothetical protein